MMVVKISIWLYFFKLMQSSCDAILFFSFYPWQLIMIIIIFAYPIDAAEQSLWVDT